MRAFQSQRTQARRPPKRPAAPTVALRSTPRVQAKSGCACGGSCPACRDAPEIQAKLKIGAPDDIYEREADAVADRVMRMRDADLPASAISATGANGTAMRQPMEDQEEEIQMKPASDTALQLKGDAVSTKASSSDTSHAANAASRSGSPLSPELRAFFEPRFGYDFSQVRVHHDSEAAGAADSVQARAYTLGSDIVFNSNQFAPQTAAGRRLLAHELTHVVQQSGSGVAPTVQRAVYICDEYQSTNRRNFGPGINMSCSGNAASITANMEISGSLATSAYANTLKSTIENHWNQSFDEGYQVDTTANIAVQGSSPNNSKTQIEIINATGVSNVSRYWVVGARHMQYYSGSDINWTPAHEFGHLLGLDDRYSENDFAQIFGADRETTADTGWSGNIMAEHNGVVEKKNVRQLLNNCSTTTCVRGHLENPM